MSDKVNNPNDEQRFGCADDPFRQDPRFSTGLAGYESVLPRVNPDEAVQDAEKEVDDLWRRGANLNAEDFQTGKQKSELREFLENVSINDLQEALAKGGTPVQREKIAQAVQDRNEEQYAQEFTRRNPDYLATDHNRDEIFGYLEEHGLELTTDTLQQAYDDLLAQGLLDVPDGSYRPLTEREAITVIRLAQQQKLVEAIAYFLHYSLPGWPPERIESHCSDPDLLPLMDMAAFFVFKYSQLDFVDNDQNRAFLAQFADGRPLTVELLQTGWAALKANPSQANPQPEQEPEQIDLNSLSNEEIEQALHQAGQLRARQLGRG